MQTPENQDASPNGTPPDLEIGELTVGEMRAIESLRAAADGVIRDIGGLEVRKSQLITRLTQYEAQAQGVLQGAAARLNIPKGEAWHVTPEGKVRRGSTAPTTS